MIQTVLVKLGMFERKKVQMILSFIVWDKLKDDSAHYHYFRCKTIMYAKYGRKINGNYHSRSVLHFQRRDSNWQ